jgi:hypothetical protein
MAGFRDEMLAKQRQRAIDRRDQSNDFQGMFSKIPGALANAHEAMPWWDKAALYTAPVPVVGDVVGFGADMKTLYDDPSLQNLGWGVSGLLPFVPSGGVRRTGQKALTNLMNNVDGFYAKGAGKAGQIGAWAKTMPEGVSNMAQARYGTSSRAIQKEYGISVADQKVAKRALEVSAEVTPKLEPLNKAMNKMRTDGTAYVEGKLTRGGNKVKTPQYAKLSEEASALRSVANTAGKKAQGQLNQSRSMINQYQGAEGGTEGFLKNIDEIDHVKTFDKFNVDDYYKTVGDLANVSRDDIGEIFKHIQSLPAIGMKGRDYQMNVRRVHTGSAGELDPGFASKFINGRKSSTKYDPATGEVIGTKMVSTPLSPANIKDTIFTRGGKHVGFTSDRAFLDTLKKQGMYPLNPVDVLKGKAAIFTGSGTSDAWELGGVNYMTAINKKGKMTTIINDEHDMLGQKLPGGSRYMNVTEPIAYDLVKPKKSTVKQKNLKAKLSKQKKAAEARALEQYANVPGVNTEGTIPVGFKTKEQWARTQAVANLKPTRKDYSRLALDTGLFTPMRVTKPLVRNKEDE